MGEKKEKRKNKGKKKYFIGAAIALVIAYFLSGNLHIGLNQGEEKSNPDKKEEEVKEEDVKVVVEDEKDKIEDEKALENPAKSEVIVNINADKLSVDGKEMSIEEFSSMVGDGTRVIVRSEDAKVVFYEDFKDIVAKKGGLIIEE